MKHVVRKKKNAQSAIPISKRGYRKLFVQYNEQARQIARLEERISSLATIMQDAGIPIPPDGNSSSAKNSPGPKGSSVPQETANESGEEKEFLEEMMRIAEGKDED